MTKILKEVAKAEYPNIFRQWEQKEKEKEIEKQIEMAKRLNGIKEKEPEAVKEEKELLKEYGF